MTDRCSAFASTRLCVSNDKSEKTQGDSRSLSPSDRFAPKRAGPWNMQWQTIAEGKAKDATE
jgi:hypothetical protein